VPTAAGRRPLPTAQAARRRAQGQKRRRDVFFALLAGVVGSLVLGIIPGLHAMLYIQVLFDLLMAMYLGLLIRMRNLAAERELKLAYMPGNRRVQEPGYAPVQPIARRAVTARESYQDEYDYEFDYGYSELAVRRAAN
jgi:predicted lipid-binding transport protein (Tim44 family)